MINKVILIGNLGKDPEIRELEGGVKVGKLTIATNENYKDSSGEWQKKTEWHNIVVWRWLAERAENYLKKGKLVYVEGKLTTRKWQDTNNVDRYTTEVVARELRILERREDAMAIDSGFPSIEEAINKPKSLEEPIGAKDYSNSQDDDDLPF